MSAEYYVKLFQTIILMGMVTGGITVAFVASFVAGEFFFAAVYACFCVACYCRIWWVERPWLISIAEEIAKRPDDR